MQRSSQIEARLKAAEEAHESGDRGALASVFSDEPESLSIGTDPDEWWRGHDEIAKAVQADPGGGRLEDVEAYEEGSVGWVVARGSFVEGEVRLPFRTTAVLHREGGDWKIVQAHTSIGVPNDQITNPILQPARAEA